MISGSIVQVGANFIYLKFSAGFLYFSAVIDLSCRQELETSLEKKEIYVKELENSLSELNGINSRQRSEINLLNERLTNEARRVKMLEREGDRLRSDISLLESKVRVPRLI